MRFSGDEIFPVFLTLIFVHLISPTPSVFYIKYGFSVCLIHILIHTSLGSSVRSRTKVTPASGRFLMTELAFRWDLKANRSISVIDVSVCRYVFCQSVARAVSVSVYESIFVCVSTLNSRNLCFQTFHDFCHYLFI